MYHGPVEVTVTWRVPDDELRLLVRTYSVYYLLVH